MDIEKTNKVTDTANKGGKSNARGEKCLAKFTATNGNVYGSLTLDIRKRATIRNRSLLLCVCVMLGKKLSCA